MITTSHSIIKTINENGDINILYPQTTGADVQIAPTDTVNKNTLQELVNELKPSAFIENFEGIDDSNSSDVKTYSSDKINSLKSGIYTYNDNSDINIDSNDYIPFYDTSASSMKKILKRDLNIEAGGCGSSFVITTDESSLNGCIVSITDGVKTWQSVFNNGIALISSVDGIGQLTITATDGIDTAHRSYTVENYSRYDISLNFHNIYGFKVDSTKATNSVSYNVEYDGKKVVNYNYNPAYMDFSNDVWVWGDWSEDEFFIPVPVLIKQDLSDKIYLNQNDLTLDIEGNNVSDKLTGVTDGYNAMMEWGKYGKRIWYKLVPDSNDNSTYTCYVADYKADNDFVAWSFYDCNDNLMEHFYMSIYNSSVINNELRSLSNKTIASSIGGNEPIYAKANNKNNEEYAWYIGTFADRLLVNLLTVLITKSINSDVIGYGNYSGTLDDDVITITGLGNTKGLFYGKQSNSIVKVFGIEFYYSNKHTKIAGYIFDGITTLNQLYKLTYGTIDGSTDKGYVETNSVPSNYITGNTIPTNLAGAYITKESAYTNGVLLPSGFGGSNGTYYSDAGWSNSSTNHVMYMLAGGRVGNNSATGIWTFNVNFRIVDGNAGITSHISLKPPVPQS